MSPRSPLLKLLFLAPWQVTAANPWTDGMCADWVEEKLENGRALKECHCNYKDPRAQDSPFGDYGQTKAGGFCDGDTAIYCDCMYREKGSAWACDVVTQQQCTVGSPKCKWGKCKDLSQACGAAEEWTVDINAQTCQTLFTDSESSLRNCETAFGNKVICPSSVVTSDYVGWANFMKDANKQKDGLRQTALDVVWFYNKLKTMVNTSFATSAEEAAVEESGLKNEKITAHFESFRDFSCLRNFPQCEGDEASTATCENKCDAVTSAIETWSGQCSSLASSHTGVICEPLGYVRDCDNTKGEAAGDWPGLCVAFQNEPLTGRRTTDGATSYSVTAAIAIVVSQWL